MERVREKAHEYKSRISRRLKGGRRVLSRSTTLEPLACAATAAAGPMNPVPTDSAFIELGNSIDNLLSVHAVVGLPSISIPPAPATPPIIRSNPVVMVTPAPIPRRLTPPIKKPEDARSKSKINEGAWTGLDAFAEALKKVGGSFGPLKSAVELFTGSIELFNMTAKNREQYRTLKADLDMRFEHLAGYFKSPVPPTMTSSIENLAKGIVREIDYVKSKANQSTLSRYGKAEQDADDILECYRRVDALLARLVQNANMNIWKIVDKLQTEQRLKDLSHSSDAWYSSAQSEGRRKKCTQNTRIQVLSDMKQWAYTGLEKVYWLNGMAGTGKTTIAYSLSDELHQDRKLAASFFCSRQLRSCSNVNLIFPTLSYQLARFSHPFQCALSGVLDQHPDVHTRALSEQFQGLIAGPLSVVAKAMPKDLVVVIDGLDECDRQDGVEIILNTLLSTADSLPIKFFVSSRPEEKIVTQMQSTRNGQLPFQLRLHELEHSVVSHDIEVYLKAELKDMELSAGEWKTLIRQCGVLFIYAATAVRYIQSGRHARRPERLKKVLSSPNLAVNDGANTIDRLYRAILNAAFENKDLEDVDRRSMMLVLHSVICIQEPLTSAALSKLLQIPNEALVVESLVSLSSVLSISEASGVVGTLHASFPDYLFDQNRSEGFHCSQRTHNARLAHACFDMMKTPSPPFNICRLESSFVFDKDVPGLDQRVDDAVSMELYYACRYWGSHLTVAETSKSLFSELDEFLRVRFLLWMEVMNLKKSMSTGASILSQVHGWGQAVCSKDIQSMIMDALSFSATFSLSPASESTPHIYISTLAVWPKERAISRCYSDAVKNMIKLEGTAVEQPRSPLRASITTNGAVVSIKCSPNGARIVSGLSNGMIGIWDAYTGQMIGDPLEGHTGSTNSVSYSPDGARIVSGSSDRTIRIWDVHTGQMVGRLLEGHTGEVNSVAYSMDGVHIVSGSEDNTIRIWDACTGQMVGHPLKGHNDVVRSVSYSPDGTHIVSGSDDRTIRIWNTHSGQMVGHPLKGHIDWVRSVSYSPDGAQIVSGSSDNTIRIWDSHTGHLVGYPLEGHTGGVRSVSYSPDGAHIVSGSFDSTIRIWDAYTGHMISDPLEGHTDVVRSVSYSPDGAHIFSGSFDGTIRIWDAQTGRMGGRLLEGHNDWVNSVSYSPNGAHIVSGSNDSTIRIWDAHTGQMVGHPPQVHTDPVNSVSYSPDGSHIVSGSSDSTIWIWDSHTGQIVDGPLEGHTRGVYSVSYSPDGAHIVSGSFDSTIRIWDACTGQPIGHPLEGHTDWVRSVSYSPDGVHIVSGSDDRTIRIWDARTGQMVGDPLKGHTDSVRSVSYSPNGTHIISGSFDSTIRMWDAHTGQMVGCLLEVHTDSIRSVSYSPDGAHIVSGSFDKAIRISDAHTGHKVGHPLEGHTDWVNSVSYSPDGAHIVSGSSDGTIRIWNAQTGKMAVHPLVGHTDFSMSVSHSTDVAYIITGSADSTIQIRDAHTRQMISTQFEGRTHSTQSGLCSQTGPEPRQSLSSTQFQAPFTYWSLNPCGWVVSSSSELIIWVPLDLRPKLCPHGTTVIVRKEGYVRLDFSSAALGPQWFHCYQSMSTASTLN